MNSNQPMQKLLTPEDVAELLGVTTHTLAVWRHTKRYPLAYTKIGRLVRYRVDDVMQFVAQRAAQ